MGTLAGFGGSVRDVDLPYSKSNKSSGNVAGLVDDGYKGGTSSDLTIMSRNSSRGNSSAITHCGVELNTRQTNLLNKLNAYDSSIVVGKKDVGVR